MSSKEMMQKIRKYFQETSDYSPDYHENLFESGALDSFGIVEFLTFLEEKAGAQIELEDITMENFSTIDTICKLIES